MYKFKTPLIEANIIKRNNQFTLDAEIDGRTVKVHCPTRGRIGNIDIKDITGLLSISDNPKRKTKYTLEAISVSNKNVVDKQYIGINQIASNKYIEYFLENNSLKDIIDSPDDIKREVKLGNSKLDFLVDNTYVEVKTPLETLQIEYDSEIKTKTVKPLASTDRFLKHIKELAESLEHNQKAILLTVFQYPNPGFKIINPSVNYKTVQATVKECLKKGVELWQVNMSIGKSGVSLDKYWDITENFIKNELK